jgi:DNA-directed RNA polymerase III subunit RPC6
MLVYQVISQAGNTGIWTRDMKARTNLAQTKITKTLRSLEERGLIKAVKSVQNASRKVYMLASLEPAKEITGGPWYGADQQPDREFIDAIRKVAQLYVESRASKGQLASVEEVADTIASSGVSNQILQTDDVDGILKTLVYDSHLEMFEVGDPPVTKYGAAKVTVPEGVPLTDCPCGVCPVFNDCHEGGPVAPERCDYYKKWLGELEF